MAVQAQYPSNVLFPRRNGGQEGVLDYSLQPQPGGFLHQFNNGGANDNTLNSNPRKRTREVDFSAGGISTATAVNQINVNSQTTSQFIELSQLHNLQSRQNVVSTGLRLSSGDQQHQIHHNQQQQQPSYDCQSEDFYYQIKRQREEIDQYLQAQGEQLRRTLADRRNRHYRALIAAAEESIGRRLREKEAEVEKAARRNAELEARAAQLSAEAQAWQAKEREQEAAAAALQGQLQQAIMNGGAAQDSRRGDDGLGCAGGESGQAEDAGSAYVDPERAAASGGPICKGCRRMAATAVVLPCRHLCLCTECDQLAQACPLCFQVRNSSVEVFLY